jgi:hypothetical protein
VEPEKLSQTDKVKFVGEEDNDGTTNPEMDLAAAVAIALFSLIGLYLAFKLDIPDTIFTAPGLFPVFAASGLFAMAIGLAIKALNAGATTNVRPYFRQLSSFFHDEENARCGQLIAIIAAYILAVDWLGFDIRIPTGLFVIRFSSFELFSIIALTLIFKMFWKVSWGKCILVAVGWSLILATVFRFGFRILLPGSG